MNKWIFACLLGVSQTATAQYMLKGSIIDENHKPIAGLAINIAGNNGFNKKISSTVSGGSGDFVFNLTERGKYKLTCNSIFYRDTVISEVDITSQTVLLGPVMLYTLPVLLKDVKVTGRKKLYEFDAGKRIYQVSADPTVAGLSGIEAINNMPGVSATEEGPVLFRGTGEAILLVDGRRVPGMPGQYLAQLASHLIERIEVSDNTTRFNAQNNGVVVNIILKRAAINEWRGFLTVQAGYPLKQVTGLSSLYNTKKAEFSLDIGTTLHHHPGRDSYQRETNHNNETASVLNTSEGNTRHFTRKFQVGLMWKPDSTFNYLVSLYGQLWPDKSDNTFTRIASTNNIVSSEQRDIHSTRNNFDNLFTELQQGLSKKFSSKWLATLNFDMNKSTDGISTQTLFAIPYNGEDFTNRNRHELRGELVYTAVNDRVMRLGFQTSKSRSNAGASFSEGISGGSYNVETDYYVKAAYLAGDMKFNSGFYFNGGIRYEGFFVDAAINGTGKNNIQSTNGLFPTLAAGYKKGKEEFRILLKRGIRRPSIFNMIPVSSLFSNKYDKAEINLFVKPAITDAYELSYSNDLEKNGLLSITLFYRMGKNEFEDVFSFTAEGNSQRKLQNIGQKNTIGFDVNYNLKYLKNFTSNLNITGAFDKYNNDLLYNPQTELIAIDLNNTVQLHKSISARLRVQHKFQSKSIWAVNESVTIVNAAVSYQFADKRAAVTADVTDLFLGNVTKGYRYVPGGFETFSGWWDSRVIRIGATYRLGKLNREVKGNLRGE